jgi:hypothetical protein
LREYGARWTGRHPYPYDFFNTVESVAGRDLGWFWTTWFYEPWSLDQAIGAVRSGDGADALAVTIEDRGLAPMPVHLTITRSDGSREEKRLPVDIWLTGQRSYVLQLPNAANVARIEIDAARDFPDINTDNQVWVRRE